MTARDTRERAAAMIYLFHTAMAKFVREHIVYDMLTGKRIGEKAEENMTKKNTLFMASIAIVFIFIVIALYAQYR